MDDSNVFFRFKAGNRFTIAVDRGAKEAPNYRVAIAFCSTVDTPSKKQGMSVSLGCLKAQAAGRYDRERPRPTKPEEFEKDRSRAAFYFEFPKTDIGRPNEVMDDEGNLLDIVERRYGSIIEALLDHPRLLRKTTPTWFKLLTGLPLLKEEAKALVEGFFYNDPVVLRVLEGKITL